MDLMEVLFVSDAGQNPVTCSAWDYRTGTNLMNYKGGGCAQKHSLIILRNEYVLAANSMKPLMHVWPINHQEQISATRFVLPGRADALALSTDCFFLVAGIQETLYIWNILTGRMMNMISKHYQPITCLRFIDTGSHFVSASRDGGILVWNLTKAVSHSFNEENQQPLYSFSDHGLPVTDIHIGYGGLRAFMFTCSLDRTCKVYDLSNGKLLLSVVFAETLHSVIANAMETCVYVGTSEGNVYEFRIDPVPRTKEFHAEKEHTNKFSGHKAGTIVNCLALSKDGQTLVSGGQDEQICVWHIQSRQLIKTISHKGAITNIELKLISPTIFEPQRKQPHVFGGSLKRMLDPPEADEEEVMEVLVTEANQPIVDEEIPIDRIVRRTYENPSTPSKEPMEAKSTSSDAEEIEKLRAEVQRLKMVNKQLYESAVDSVIVKRKRN